MKPLYIALLAFCTTATVGIGLILIHEPKPQAIVAGPAVTPSAPQTAAAVPVTAAPHPKAHRKAKAKQLLATSDRQAVPRPILPISPGPFPLAMGDGQSGGIFSGADPKDPRIYHFTDQGQ
jgi:hypothetical protein